MFKKLRSFFFKKNNEDSPYLFCDEINDRLHFFNKQITYCSIGNTSNNRLYPILVDNFTGQKLNFKKLLKKIDDDKKTFKEGNVIESCKNCQRLRVDNWGGKRTPFKLVQFSDWGLCNSKCVYCGSWQNTILKEGKYLTKDGKPDTYPIIPIIKNMIKSGLIIKDTSVNFAGGEPTLYFQFSEAIRFLLNYGIKRMEVYSNIINYSPEIEKGLAKGVIELTVSIDAGSKATHELVKGVQSHDKVWENFTQYVKAAGSDFNKNVVSKFVIVPEANDSFSEIEEWINKSKEIGITNFILNADNRIYENGPPAERLSNKLKELNEFFVTQMDNYKFDYKLGPNITGLYN